MKFYFVPWAVQKRLNRPICRLGCALGRAVGGTSSIVFARWHQYTLMGGHIGAAWRIQLNHPSAAVMRPYVKLLWPFVVVVVIIRPHRSTLCVDVAYCCGPSLLVRLSREPCKNGCTYQDSIWVEDLGGPKKPCIRWGSRSPMGRGSFEGEGAACCNL